MIRLACYNLSGAPYTNGSIVLPVGETIIQIAPGMEDAMAGIVSGMGQGTNYTYMVGVGSWAESGSWVPSTDSVNAFWWGFGLVFTLGLTVVGLKWVKSIIGGGHAEVE